MRKTLCDVCGEEILEGKKYTSIVINVESIGKDRFITVHDSEELRIYHIKCFDKKKFLKK